MKLTEPRLTMTFANPIALLLLLLAVPVVWLYRRRFRPRPEPTTTVHLWSEAVATETERARARWQPWRQGVSLAAQLTALVLLVLALAEPLIPAPTDTVLIVDTSASMNARDAGPEGTQTRLAAARDAARRLIASMRHGDRIAVVAADERPRLLVDLTGKRDALRWALDAVGEPAGRLRLEAAERAAAALLARLPRPRVVLLSDGCGFVADAVIQKRGANETRRASPAAKWVRWVVGRGSNNVGVARLSARRSLGQPTTCDVFVRVVNHGEKSVSRRLRFTLDARPIAGSEATIDIPPDGQFERTFQIELPTAGTLRAQLDAGDLLPDDDHRAVALPAPEVMYVEPVGELNPMLMAALESNPFIVLIGIPGNELPGPELPGPELPGPEVRVIRIAEGMVPEEIDGPLLLVNPPEEFDPAALGGVADRAMPGSPVVINRAQGKMIAAYLNDPNRAEWPVMIDAWLSEVDEFGEARGNPRSADEGEAFPTSESELRAPADFGRPALEIAADPPGTPPWTYLAAVAGLLAVAQWCLFQRRWLS